jgi:hypothetical protein
VVRSQGHLGHVKQRVDRLRVPVRRPDQRREVGHDERVHDRVEARQVLLPQVQEHALACEVEVALDLSADRHGDRGVDRGASPLDRADDRARGVIAADLLEPVQDLAAPVAVDDDDQVQDARGRMRTVARVLRLEQVAERLLDVGGRGVLGPPAGALVG